MTVRLHTYSHIKYSVYKPRHSHGFGELERDREGEGKRETAKDCDRDIAMTTCSETGREKAREIAKERRRRKIVFREDVDPRSWVTATVKGYAAVVYL